MRNPYISIRIRLDIFISVYFVHISNRLIRNEPRWMIHQNTFHAESFSGCARKYSLDPFSRTDYNQDPLIAQYLQPGLAYRYQNLASLQE